MKANDRPNLTIRASIGLSVANNSLIAMFDSISINFGLLILSTHLMVRLIMALSVLFSTLNHALFLSAFLLIVTNIGTVMRARYAFVFTGTIIVAVGTVLTVIRKEGSGI